MKPIAKNHIDRLRRMVDRLNKRELYLQQTTGDYACPGTPRAVDIKDAATLRHVIAYLELMREQK